MRLDFKVLCIDDQPDNVTGAIDHLSQHVYDEGFQLVVEFATSLEEAVSLISDDVLVDGIDLVLVDYDLGPGSPGDEVLAQIRAALPYKELVFYSARPTTDLRRLAFEAGVDGVYCANRTGLGETIAQVFDALVKKVLDLDHCRGIILGATSEVDHLVNDILRTMDGQFTTDERATSLAFALKRIDAKLTRFQGIRDRLAGDPTIEALLEAHELFTSKDRLLLLMRVYDRRYTKKGPFRQIISTYTDRIPIVRNMFGHVRLSAGAAKDALKGFGTEKLDADSLRSVRKELIHFREEFQKFAQFVEKLGLDTPDS